MSSIAVDDWIRRVEDEEGPFPCPYPDHQDRAFPGKRSLEAHIRMFHDGVVPAPFACPRDECDETFPTRKELEMHLSAGHVPTIGGRPIEPEGEMPSGEGEDAEMPDEEYICRKGCDRSFPTPQGRALHETVVHTKRDRSKAKPTSRKRATSRKRTTRKTQGLRGRAGAQARATVDRMPHPELQRIDQILALVEQLDPASRRWLADRLYREQVAS